MRFRQNLYVEEQKVCFEENSKWRIIYLDANGRGLYGEMRHDPRNPVKNKFWFYDLWFKSYSAKRKVGCYSATMWPTDVIIFLLMFVLIIHLPVKCWKCSPYSVWEKNTCILLVLTWESMGNYDITYFIIFQYVPPLGFLRTFDMLLLTYLWNKNSWKRFFCNLFDVNPLFSIIWPH